MYNWEIKLLKTLKLVTPSAKMNTRANRDAREPRDEQSHTASEIKVVGIKIAPFWKTNPDVWFMQLEAQFRSHGIVKQEAKFDYVAGNIDAEIAGEVADIIRNPPDIDPYNCLKTAIINRTTVSDRKKFQQLLSQEELGDRKPSQFLRKLHQLLGDRAGTFDQEFLKELFLQRMPPSVKGILVAQRTSLEEMADLADRILDTFDTRPTIAAVTAEPDIAKINSRLDRIEQTIGRLERAMSTISCRGSRSPKRRSCSRSRAREREASQTGLCFYHARFQEKAHKCVPPCRWKAGNA